MLQVIEALHTLLLTNAVKSNSATARINERLKLLFASTELSFPMTSHSLRKIYANWAYTVHGTPDVAEYAYICQVLGQNFNPSSAASYSYLNIII